jgi:hypothetical protein
LSALTDAPERILRARSQATTKLSSSTRSAMRARILRCCADSRPVHDPRLDLPGGLQVVLAAGLQPKPSRNPPEKNRRTESAAARFPEPPVFISSPPGARCRKPDPERSIPLPAEVPGSYMNKKRKMSKHKQSVKKQAAAGSL